MFRICSFLRKVQVTKLWRNVFFFFSIMRGLTRHLYYVKDILWGPFEKQLYLYKILSISFRDIDFIGFLKTFLFLISPSLLGQTMIPKDTSISLLLTHHNHLNHLLFCIKRLINHCFCIFVTSFLSTKLFTTTPLTRDIFFFFLILF